MEADPTTPISNTDTKLPKSCQANCTEPLMKHELPPKYCMCLLPANKKLPSCTPWKDDLKDVFEIAK